MKVRSRSALRVAVVMVLALLACKSKSSKEQAYAEELQASTPSNACSVTRSFGDELHITCNELILKAATDSTRDELFEKLKTDCKRIQDAGYRSIWFDIDNTIYKSSDAKTDGCELKRD